MGWEYSNEELRRVVGEMGRDLERLMGEHRQWADAARQRAGDLAGELKLDPERLIQDLRRTQEEQRRAYMKEWVRGVCDATRSPDVAAPVPVVVPPTGAEWTAADDAAFGVAYGVWRERCRL